MTTMNFGYFFGQLTHNAENVRQFCQGVSDEQARWRPDPDSWSMLEVINHLLDEEREDFPVRLDHILHRPGESWPAIDPQGWVVERAYNRRDFAESLDKLLRERQKSLVWLQSQGKIDWQASRQAPWGQPIRAGDMFAAWAAHDLLHLRQLTELKLAYAGHLARPYQVEYAGS